MTRKPRTLSRITPMTRDRKALWCSFMALYGWAVRAEDVILAFCKR